MRKLFISRRTRKRITAVVVELLVLILLIELLPDLYLSHGVNFLNFYFDYHWNGYNAQAVIDQLRSDEELDPKGYFVRKDVNLSAIHVSHHARVTDGNPNPTIYLFGNSAIFGSFVPDTQSPNAQIHHLTGQRVVNFGTDSETISVSTARLMNTPLKPGDIVIFMDGSIDLNGLYPEAAWCNIQIGIVQLLCLYTDRTLDRAALTAHIAAIKESIAQARQYAAQQSVQFLHIWQPIMLNPTTPAENALRAKLWAYGQGGYVSGEAPYAELRTADPLALDLSSPWHGGDWTDYVIDGTHFTDKGNQIIAQAIVDHLDFEF
jgi:hypothetical protein